MYTNEDLKSAIDAKIFTQESVEAFRTHIAQAQHSPAVDEENFKLISGFNDIFVVIASILVLLSASWVTYDIHPTLSAAVSALLSWGLAEFFVKQRKMALPAIVLLVTFVGSIFLGTTRLFPQMSEEVIMLAAAVSGIAAFIHWKRFAVPLTIAAGIATVVVFLVSMLLYFFHDLVDYVHYIIFIIGLMTFAIAMYWDASDTKRISNNSDVAFWLHLLAAPLIVHPVFSILGVFDSQSGLATIFVIVILYLVLSSISLIIDRRAFMVSSLAYVLYAFTTLFKNYGIENNSFAISGVFIGLSLLLLSGYWSKARSFLLQFMPQSICDKVPLAHH